MMKVLYLISTLQRCGPVNVLFNLLKYIDRKCFEPVILTLSKEPADSSLDNFNEIKIKVLSLNLSRIKGMLHLSSHLNKVVDSICPDIVHSQGIRADYLSCRYLNSYSRITTLQNYPYYDYPAKYGKIKGKIMACIHLKIISRLPYKVACAGSLSSVYAKKHDLQIPYIQNGVDDEMFSPAAEQEKTLLREKYSLLKFKKVFITIGNLIYRKNTETVIAAFMKSSAGNKSVLLVMGDGVLLRRLQTLANGHNSIRFLGNIVDIVQYKDYLQMSDYFISASFAEGLPTAVMEALSCGLPCVLSDIEAHREILSYDTNAGRIISVKDTDGLANVIDELAETDAAGMSKAASGIIRNHISARKMAQRYQEFYKNSIKGNKLYVS